MPLGLHGYNLQTEKNIEIMSKCRPIEKHDTTVGAWQTMQTKNMMAVSRIEKCGRIKMEVLLCGG